MVVLSGQQLKTFHEALLSAFSTPSALGQFLRFRLDQPLEPLMGSNSYSDLVFDVLKWAESNGRLEELMIEALLSYPGNPLLKTASKILLSRGKISFVERVLIGFDWVNSRKLALLVYHLGHSRFEWRYQETLVKRTGISAAEIDELVVFTPENIIRGIGKRGGVIYRLSTGEKQRFIDLFPEA
jgi:hypothetical protein